MNRNKTADGEWIVEVLALMLLVQPIQNVSLEPCIFVQQLVKFNKTFNSKLPLCSIPLAGYPVVITANLLPPKCNE